jgi:CheY-like chemotaxis protein
VRGEPWGASIYLVALSGWGREEDKRRAIEAGFDAHLVKPVDISAIEKIIAERGSPQASASASASLPTG